MRKWSLVTSGSRGPKFSIDLKYRPARMYALA